MESLERVLEVVASRPWLAATVGVAAVLALAVLAHLVVRRVLLRLVTRAIRASRLAWDDALIEHRVLGRAAWLAPLLVLWLGLPEVPHLAPVAAEPLRRGLLAALVVVALSALNGLIGAAGDVYGTLPIARDRPIKGYLQILKIFLAVLAGVLIVAVLLDRSPVVLLTGIGALTAVLLLIFRDTILSFVASLQLASNDMVRLGDWIEMPKYNADGDVIDIALHTVKVQNWDKTITTIPTYKLIEDSFKNWRGMEESGGRRIKRALHLDMTSVRFLDQDDLDRLSRFVLLADYLAEKRHELDGYNRTHLPAGSDRVANARRLTNLGTFRAYVAAYLRQHPKIHATGLTFLVRQLAPGPAGLPLEIYVFSRDQTWAGYEGVQADVFDHLLAILTDFGLRVFQQPTGHDLAAMRPPAVAPSTG